jgi:hypothetical protein
MKLGYKVWDNQTKSMTRYKPVTMYTVKIKYNTNRQQEFLGMDRGSCMLMAEVSKQEKENTLEVISEGAITMYKKEKA